MKIVIVMYIIGYIISYILLKLKMPTISIWKEVRIRLLLSFLSWIGVIFLIFDDLIENLPNKPPKWL